MQESYDGGAHAKFTNYYFDVDEFVKLVNEAADHVKNNTKFQEFIEESQINELKQGNDNEQDERAVEEEILSPEKKETEEELDKTIDDNPENTNDGKEIDEGNNWNHEEL